MTRKKGLSGIIMAAMAISCWAGYEKDELLWQCDFTNRATIGNILGTEATHSMADDGSLLIQNGKIYTIGVPVEKLAGKNVYLETEIRIERILQPEKPYWGAKAMLLTEAKETPTKYFEPSIPRYGTHPWTVYNSIIAIPQDAMRMQLWVGIQNSTGNLFIRNFRIYSCKAGSGDVKKTIMPNTADIPRGDFKGAKYRGFMTGRDLSAEAFRQLAEWNVNLLRYQMNAGNRDISSPEKYMAWIKDEIAAIDKILPFCEKYGIKLCLDLHSGPSGSKKNAQSSNIIADQEKVISQLEQAWRQLAAHYKNNHLIYGYDILNEPIASKIIAGELHPWDTISERVVKCIREVDPKTPIIVEADQENWRRLHYIDAPNIIYSTHTYAPVDYTHQKVLKDTPFVWEYPGVIQGKYWNKETLREDLKDVIAFQKKYHAQIYIGEFSVVGWAKGGDQYLKDLTELFEEYGWDWTYHAFREWVGWSIEHENTKDNQWIQSENNPRRQVILKALGKNKK